MAGIHQLNYQAVQVHDGNLGLWVSRKYPDYGRGIGDVALRFPRARIKSWNQVNGWLLSLLPIQRENEIHFLGNELESGGS